MTQETFLWIASAGIPAIIAFCVSITIQLAMAARDRKDQTKKIDKLVDMHTEPEKYGFGTAATNRMIEDNERAMSALVHYIKWYVEEETGKKAPPPAP